MPQSCSKNVLGTIARGAPSSMAMRASVRNSGAPTRGYIAMQMMPMICWSGQTLPTRHAQEKFVVVVRAVQEAAGVIMSTVSFRFLLMSDCGASQLATRRCKGLRGQL